MFKWFRRFITFRKKRKLLKFAYELNNSAVDLKGFGPEAEETVRDAGAVYVMFTADRKGIRMGWEYLRELKQEIEKMEEIGLGK